VYEGTVHRLNSRTPPSKRQHKLGGEGGAALVLTMLMLPVLLLLLSGLIAIAQLFTVRAHLHAVADMAALAAVQELDLERLADGEVILDEAAARARALEAVQSNVVPGGGAVLISSIEVSVYNPTGRKRPVDKISGEKLRWPTVCVSIEAAARVSWLLAVPGLPKTVTIRVHTDAAVVRKP